MSTPANGLRGSQTQAQTRLLLSLWDLQGLDQAVKRSELNKRLVRSQEKAKDYQLIVDQLEKDGAIKITTKNRSVTVSLTPQGLELLKSGLQDPDFEFSGSIIGTKFPNALLKWVRSLGDSSPVSPPLAPEAEPQQDKKASKLKTYGDFKKAVLTVYDQLNQGYNLKDLVQIYRIRREIGDRVERLQFNEWLVKMQEDDIFQLMSGEVAEMTPDKKEDSLTLPSGAFRFYAKRQKP